MSDALDKAVAETNELLKKVIAERDKKNKKYDQFTKQMKELDNKKKFKTEKDFENKKNDAKKSLTETMQAALAQRKVTTECMAKIKATKTKLTEEQQRVAFAKQIWTQTEQAYKAHNEKVNKLPPGPARDKLKAKVPDSFFDQIEEAEQTLLGLQLILDQNQAYIDVSDKSQRTFTEILERKVALVDAKTFK